MAWPERLKTARRFYGESQESMAVRLDVPYRTYQGYENGISEPKAKVLERLVELGFNGNWLLTGSEPMRTDQGTFQPPTIQAAARLDLDEELNARVVDGISRLYKEERVGLAPMDLGRLAARMYADLVNACDDPNDRPAALKFALEQLRRQLRAAPGEQSETKRLA